MKDKTPLVSVVIVHFNSGEYIFDCIKSVQEQNYPTEIIVVDNNSQDDASQKLQSLADENHIHYMPQNKNLGFSGANNLGITQSKGDYILTLNADAFLDQQYIEILVDLMQSNPKLGAITGKITSTADRNIIDTAGIILFSDGTGSERGYGEIDNGQYDVGEPVIGVCAAVALYRRKMLDDISTAGEYFNHHFFAFLEDLELAARATTLGWTAYYEPSATASHVRGGSTTTDSEFVKFLKLRNELLLNTILQGWRQEGSISFAFLLLRLLRLLTTRPTVLLNALRESRKIATSLDPFSGVQSDRFQYILLQEHLEYSYVIHRLKEKLHNIIR
ncbi:MAG: GT2 family glycosyltransferase [Flavobacterium sp.]|jgi:GT2 family glycosyltransferase